MEPTASAPLSPFVRGAKSIVDGFFVFFGIWTVYCNVSVFARGSFSWLLALSPLALALAGVVWIWLRRPLPMPAGNDHDARDPILPTKFKVGLALVIAALHALTGSATMLWALGTPFALFCCWDRPRGQSAGDGRTQRATGTLLVILTIVAAVAFTAVVHRPDADDAYYTSVPVSLMDQPRAPMLQADTMHGDPLLPLLGPYYRTVSYEVLIGVVAFLTGSDPRFTYYAVMPLLFAAMLVLVNWLCLRRLAPRGAAVGVAVTCLAMMVWGDVHHSFGNFAFVRLFQGKAVLVSVCVPAILYYAMRFTERGDTRSWVRLTLAQLTAMGLSASGLVVAPLIAGLALLGGVERNRDGLWRLTLGVLSTFPVILAALVVTMQVREFGEIVSPLDATSTVRSIEIAMGQGLRTHLAFAALLLAMATIGSGVRLRALLGFLTAAFVLLLSPWSGDLMSLAEPTFSWRSLWAIPFPLILGMLVASWISFDGSAWSRRLALGAAALLVGLFVLVPGKVTWSPENKAELKLAAYRVGAGWPAAEAAVAATPADGTILAPRRVAMWITGIRRHPRLLAVRQDYLDIVVAKIYGVREAERRRAMLEFVHGKLGTSRSLEIATEIERRAIDTVVTHPDLAAKDATLFFEELERIGYRRRDVENGFTVWTRVNLLR